MAAFIALISDAATKDYPEPEPHCGIKYVNKDYTGTLIVKVDTKAGFLCWTCNTCGEECWIGDLDKTK